MKLLLLFAALALFFSTQATHRHPGHRRHQTDDESQILRVLRDINEVRRDYAKRHGISNMHQLVPDIAMKALAELTAISCPSRTQLQNINAYEFLPLLRVFKDGYKDMERDEYERLFTNPSQTMIGESDSFRQTCREHEKINLLYVLGPEHRKIVKYGQPGSSCKEGFVNNDGLCVAASSA